MEKIATETGQREASIQYMKQTSLFLYPIFAINDADLCMHCCCDHSSYDPFVMEVIIAALLQEMKQSGSCMNRFPICKPSAYESEIHPSHKPAVRTLCISRLHRARSPSNKFDGLIHLTKSKSDGACRIWLQK